MKFVKYQGTGNDFIIVNGFERKLDLNENIIKNLCARRINIGADGFMILEKSEKYDFNMRYFNSDGREASMCGNGGRCIVAYAKYLNIIKSNCVFSAVDGIHYAECLDNNIVKLKMIDVIEYKDYRDVVFVETGSPHIVKFSSNINDIDVNIQGKKLRYDERFMPNGVNVNFIEFSSALNKYNIRTYERGVENETYSCGTGTVASALALALRNITDEDYVEFMSKGGNLKVDFVKSGNKFENVYLTGPTKLVFSGNIDTI